jgi:hypothetical protein
MAAKPFWSDELTGGKPETTFATVPPIDEAPSRGVRARRALVLMLLAAGALALGYVPALDDGSPRRGAFPLPPAASSEAPEARPAKSRRTESVAVEQVAEAKQPVVAQEPAQAQPPTPSDPVNGETSPPPVLATPVLQLPEVSQFVEDVNSLVSELPVPVGSVGG